jgi:hypothetical protein
LFIRSIVIRKVFKFGLFLLDMKYKRGQVSHEVAWLIIGLALLAVAIAWIVIAKNGGFSQISNFLNQMRFGR